MFSQPLWTAGANTTKAEWELQHYGAGSIMLWLLPRHLYSYLYIPSSAQWRYVTIHNFICTSLCDFWCLDYLRTLVSLQWVISLFKGDTSIKPLINLVCSAEVCILTCGFLESNNWALGLQLCPRSWFVFLLPLHPLLKSIQSIIHTLE